MNPEQLSDAMNELPQELLEETQAARSRRRLRWKPLAAAAACLLLAAGAWALAGRPAEPTPAPEPGDLPVLTIDRDYSGMGDYPLSAEEFAAYDGGPWQEGMELAALPVFRNTTRMDVANGFRTGGGDYAQLRRTMEQLAAAVGADVAQSAVEVRVPDETVQAAMEDAWAGGDLAVRRDVCRQRGTYGAGADVEGCHRDRGGEWRAVGEAFPAGAGGSDP